MKRGIQIYTDKTHDKQSQEVFTAPSMTATKKLRVSSKPVVENFLGLGVAITSASCYNLKQMPKEERTAFIKSIYSKEGLNLGVARLNIGSCDYSAEVYTYDDFEGDTALKHFSIDRDREYLIPMLKEVLKVKPDLYLYASPWSPPAWMKTGGNIAGGFMRDEFLPCYAEYIVRYIEEYKKEGINIRAITPQNEPECQNRAYPTCFWHPETEMKFIKILSALFKERGLEVKIWMFDHCFNGVDRVMWSLNEDKDLVNCADGVAFHYYEGDVIQTVAITDAYPSLELHFTEGGPRLYENYDTDWCKWSIMVSRSLACGYKSFTGWNLLLNETGGPNIGPFFCGGLVTFNRVTNSLDYSGQYKAFSHIAPYLTPNSKIYALEEIERSYQGGIFGYPASQKKPIEGFAIDNGDGKLVLVVINPNDCKFQTELHYNGDCYYAELLSDSVSTIVI